MYSTYNVTFSSNHCGHRKAISITYSECMFVALVMQHAKGMRHILSSLACLASYLSTLSKKLHDFREKLLNTKCEF
jgi:hypothetical protein